MKRLLPYPIIISIFIISCTQEPPMEPTEMKHYPVDSIEGIITRSNVQIDKEISSDGNGSLHITADKPVTVKLYEAGDIDIEKARLLYKAKLRTRDVKGQVYLEMWCHFIERGEFFSRSVQTPLTGTQEWSSVETPFFLKKGENPDNIKINVVVDGTGEVWVDDIRLVKAPL